MVIKDRIYGRLEVNSPVLEELINSRPVQRLKGIGQLGVPDEFYFLKGYSRFEHSVGVMLILRKLGATEEEQIAGLLHDVSHTAFSHVIDFLLGSTAREDFQDNALERIIASSEIPEILEKHSYNFKQVSRHENFGLLEREIPDVCADRFDYSMREFPAEIIPGIIEELSVSGGKMVFNSQDAARLFAANFLDRQINNWMSYEAVTRYWLLAAALKKAITIGLVQFDDFWGIDEDIIGRLKASDDGDISNILSILRNNPLPKLEESDGRTSKKFRYVDPEFARHGKFFRLSEVDEEFRESLRDAKKEYEKGVAIPKIAAVLLGL